jgi:hypothetical protein
LFWLLPASLTFGAQPRPNPKRTSGCGCEAAAAACIAHLRSAAAPPPTFISSLLAHLLLGTAAACIAHLRSAAGFLQSRRCFPKGGANHLFFTTRPLWRTALPQPSQATSLSLLWLRSRSACHSASALVQTSEAAAAGEAGRCRWRRVDFVVPGLSGLRSRQRPDFVFPMRSGGEPLFLRSQSSSLGCQPIFFMVFFIYSTTHTKELLVRIHYIFLSFVFT